MAPVIAPIAYNLVIVAAVTLGAFGIAGLAAGVVIAAAVPRRPAPHLRAMRFRFTPSLRCVTGDAPTLLLMGPGRSRWGHPGAVSPRWRSPRGDQVPSPLLDRFAFFQSAGVAITPISVATLPASWQATDQQASRRSRPRCVLRLLMFPAAALCSSRRRWSALSLGFGSASAAGIGMAGTVLAVLAFASRRGGDLDPGWHLRPPRYPDAVIVTIAAASPASALAVLTSPSLAWRRPRWIVVASLSSPSCVRPLRRRLPA
jgi:hypothetical protein